MPLACASGHSSSTKAAKDCSCARAGARAERSEHERQRRQIGERSCCESVRTIRSASYSSDTRPPPWRSSRPAISSSSSTVRTIAGEVRDSRTRSSIADRRRAEQGDDAGALVVARLASAARAVRAPAPRAGRSRPRPRIGSQRGDHVGGFGHQRRALLEQAVGAFGARIERRARHGEHLAALFAGEPRGDQRAGAPRRFDDDDADATARRSAGCGAENRARAAPSRAAFPRPPRRSAGSAPAGRRARPDRCARGRRRAPRPCRSRGWRDARRRRCRAPAPRRCRSRRRRDRAPAARRTSCRRPRHCASRRWRPAAAPERRACRAPRAAAARRRSSAAAADSPARRARRSATPRARAASIRASASLARADARRAGAPPRRARPGSASSAARAPP